MALADDQPLLLDGVEQLLGAEIDLEVVASCGTAREALHAVEELQPDVLILGLNLGDLKGAWVLERLHGLDVPTRVVVFAADDEQEETVEAVRLGARGVVRKEMEPRHLIDCVREVHAGRVWIDRNSAARGLLGMLRKEAGRLEATGLLTARELEIVRLVAEGLRNREIGARLFISEGTVKVHLHNVYEKLAVDSRVALVRLAQKRGWI